MYYKVIAILTRVSSKDLSISISSLGMVEMTINKSMYMYRDAWLYLVLLSVAMVIIMSTIIHFFF